MYGTSRLEKRVISARFGVLLGVVLEIQVWWDVNDVRTKLVHAAVWSFFMHPYKQSGRWQDMLDIV